MYSPTLRYTVVILHSESMAWEEEEVITLSGET